MIIISDMTDTSLQVQPIGGMKDIDTATLCANRFGAQDVHRANYYLLTRSKSKISTYPSSTDDDIWNRKPPDFCPQNFQPKPPRRNTRASMLPLKYGDLSKKSTRTKHDIPATLPKILQPARPMSRKMQTKFNIQTADDAKQLYAKKGMYPKKPYSNPKHHDFRQYPAVHSLGLEEFQTCKSPDPLNIYFKTQNLDIHHGLPQPLIEAYDGEQMGRPLGSQPRYEPELIMPREKWPTIPQEFTRHRPRVRTPHTVLLDTIEDYVTKQWNKEREERQQQKKDLKKQQREIKLQNDIKRGINKAMEKSHIFSRI